ncbi:MAG: UvrD-helicase domain-containing protein [Litorimonas sp.]
MSEVVDNTRADEGVDATIKSCLDPEHFKHFFLFAGAGSGKTRSLKLALEHLLEHCGQELLKDGKRVAVITYTNAAVDEIKDRVQDNPLFLVSTIHSFAWDIVRGFNDDIREYLREKLAEDIKDLEAKEAKGRAGKASLERKRSIQSKAERLAALGGISTFKYNPNGDNSGRDSLNHQEVVDLTAHFLNSKSLLGQMLVNRFPIILIDESQDTLRALIEAFLTLSETHQSSFSLGIIGDMMQRIYGDGKHDLDQAIPETWETPIKKLNHRCPRRIVELINQIRTDHGDVIVQEPRSDAKEGVVRAFIVNRALNAPQEAENDIRKRMSAFVEGSDWSETGKVKTLVLEHHMAASRLGFSNIFDPIYKINQRRTSLLDGSYPPLRFMTHRVLPLVEAIHSHDDFEVARLMKKHSPLISKSELQSSRQGESLQSASKGIKVLTRILSINDLKCVYVLKCVKKYRLFEVPEILETALELYVSDNEENESDPLTQEGEALQTILDVPFSQVSPYRNYVEDKAEFGTHQGVKGREFPHIMAITDDAETRGFMFKYAKVFGDAELTETDQKNLQDGKDNAVHRALRLLYVICSRAEQSLALVIYTEDVATVAQQLEQKGWFNSQEIVCL